VTLGLGIGTAPNYLGAGTQELFPAPIITFENIYGFDFRGSLTRDFVDIGTGQGPGKWSLTAGPRVGLDFGRDSADSPTLEGLDNISTSILLGGFVQASRGIANFNLSVGQDVIGGHDGLVVDASVGTQFSGYGWALSPSVSVSWADQNYTQTTYGISLEDTETSTLSLFEPSSGFHQASVNLTAVYALSKKWRLIGIASYSETLGEFRDSPIIQAVDGSTDGISGGITFARNFTF